jgi:hypothetical protein
VNLHTWKSPRFACHCRYCSSALLPSQPNLKTLK